MVAAISRSEPKLVERFDRVERALHWTNAVLFGVLLTTAAILYVGQLSAVVGRRELIRMIHVYSGLALPVPLVLALAGRWRHSLLADLRRLNRFDSSDRRWLTSFGRDPFVRPDKFNAGQKLNAAIVGGSIPVMLATGSIMKWFAPFPVDWRTGATFVHDWTAIGLFVLITVHVAKGLSDPDARTGMLTGRVPVSWARRARPRWHDEMLGDGAAMPAAGPPARETPSASN
jgi:formate dehydrogenase subunit gamma